MNKKTFSRLSAVILLLLTVSIPAGAQEISVEAARQTAAKFINEHAAKLPAKSRKGMMKAPPKAESLQLVYTQEDQLHESPALYVFEQPKQGGFVIASADERAYPILGYNENGTFREDSLPCCLKFILEEYGKQIAEARKQNLPRHTEEAKNESWQNIEPLLTCAWSQRAPFNNLCPIDKNTGKRCATGCVATAMAQIMYYWKWPERGVGSYSYQTANVEGTLTANFGETTYRWDLMKDVYDSQRDENGNYYYDDPENAVATLMYHCGVALEMDYSSSGSGAISSAGPYKTYFNYSTIADDFDGNEQGIYDELFHGRPMQVSGGNARSLHAYVCDGYRTDGFYHFNLGLGRGSSGYYKWGAVSGYTTGVDAYKIMPKNEKKDENGFVYQIMNEGACLIEAKNIEGDVEVPSEITLENGVKYPVVEIHGAFSGNRSITSVTIPNSIERIGVDAFSGCSGLTSITIPNSVTSIGMSAFNGCSGLTSVTIGNSVTSIGYRAFSYCSGLTSITIPNSVTHIGVYAFEGCSGLTSVTIGNSVTSIGAKAFEGCSGLTSVTIPNSVTAIGSWAFYETGIYNNSADGVFYINKWVCGYKGTMPANTNLVIREGTLGIADNAFSGCSGLTSITIPNSVTSIGDYAFEGCSGLTSITIPNSVTSIGGKAFYGCSGLTSVTIPNSVTSIGVYAFEGCSGLTSVTFHCKEIGVWFQGNTTIKEIIFGEEVTSIGYYAFYGCSGLTSVTFHCKEIGPWFRGITTIKEIILGEEVTSIGEEAFYGCSGLTSISIPNSVTSIGDYAFNECSGLTSVTFHCKEIGSWFKYISTIKEIVLGEEVKSIGGKAFIGCSGLTSVTIPNSVTSIGVSAFHGCSGLTSVTIPNSVTSIGEKAFYGCSGLTSITIPNSVTSIQEWAFSGCPSLTSVTSCIENPFAIDKSVFLSSLWNRVFTDATLYVPIGTSEKYKSTDGWKYFKNIVEIEIDGIEDVTVNNSKSSNSENAPMYNLSGQRVGKNYKGIVIKNGKKMIVK